MVANEPHIVLAKDINKSDASAPVRTSLDTNRRIIRRVTDGIYREPWAAFRELISNAYDADANVVRITTDWPRFKEIHISDDGNGMSAEALAYLVKNIGGSAKRTRAASELGISQDGLSDTSPNGRKLIGKIGIGLFAVNHLTQHFQIITKKRGEKNRTIASILMETYQDDESAEASRTETGQVVIWQEKATNDKQHGTTIILRDLRPAIIKSLQSFQRWEAINDDENAEFPLTAPDYHIGDYSKLDNKKDYDLNLPWGEDVNDPLERFKTLFGALSEKNRVDRRPDLMTLDNYFQMLWKLSLSCPVQYIRQHPFDIKGKEKMYFFGLRNEARKKADTCQIEENQTLSKHFNLKSRKTDPAGGFTVFFDDVELRRPVSLPSELMGKQQRVDRPLMFVGKQETSWTESEEKRGGGKLSFEAYLYWNSGILPKENNGVLINVRGASGILFDQTFLNYQISEQTRLRQITAEIFITEGLESALNADRESFNFSHPHYLFLRDWFHSAVRQLTNKHKEIGAADLKVERAKKQEDSETEHKTLLQNIWIKSKGEDEDKFEIEFKKLKPSGTELNERVDLQNKRGELVSYPVTPLPTRINDRSIIWPENLDFLTVDKAVVESLVVILEAYGLFEELPPEVRGNLLNDLLTALQDDL